MKVRVLLPEIPLATTSSRVLTLRGDVMMRTLSLICLLTATAAHAADWPQWLGPNRDGSTTEKVAPWKKGDLKVLWRKPVAGEGNSSAVVVGNRVYLHTKLGNKQEEALTAFD